MDSDDTVSLLDSDNELDTPDRALIGVSNALVGAFKLPDEGKKTPSRSSTASFSTVELDASGGSTAKPAVSTIAAAVAETANRPTAYSASTTDDCVELIDTRATGREIAVLGVLRANGAHFTAAGRAARAEELGMMEEGKADEDSEQEELLKSQKKLGMRAAAGYASLKTFIGDICEGFGTAHGAAVGDETAREKLKWYEYIWLGVTILFGWVLWALAALLGPLKKAAAENPLKALAVLVIWIVMLARGVSPWQVLIQSIDSYKAKKE
ncbi:hypothetical protein CALCODRAFT_487954 [Calocera cornea HHB12733]|uniref:Uncharacterized protein n=1 Tax=Calocera cornea HHB12733 TaxID=1353952 RepID=A0A165CUA1_9BASI|nr:hypothetical protein CALCODRAFT_487954 [Calocera cornea HHB12733]